MRLLQGGKSAISGIGTTDLPAVEISAIACLRGIVGSAWHSRMASAKAPFSRAHWRRRSMKLKPLGDRVIVKAVEEEATTASEIFLPDTAMKKPQKCKVLSFAEFCLSKAAGNR